MDILEAQFAIMKNLTQYRQVDRTVVNSVMSSLEEETDKRKLHEWIEGNSIDVTDTTMGQVVASTSDEGVVALVRNRETDKNIAVFGHNSNTGRIVGRITPSDIALQKLFNKFVEQSIIVYETEESNGSRFTRRRKVVPKDLDYLKHLLSRFIVTPYDVRWIKSLQSSLRLDDLVDQLFREEVAADAV